MSAYALRVLWIFKLLLHINTPIDVKWVISFYERYEYKRSAKIHWPNFNKQSTHILKTAAKLDFLLFKID